MAASPEQVKISSELEASGAETMLRSATLGGAGPDMMNSSYLGNERSYEAAGSPGGGGGRLRPIPKERLKYQKYVVYGEQQQQEVDDGLNSSQLSFEDASRLHSSAIAMETATIQTLRNEKWHLSCEIDTLRRSLEAERGERKTVSDKLESLQAQYEAKLRMLRDSTVGEIRKESLHTKELELALYHKDTQLKELLLMKADKDNKDTEVWRQKAEHFERELQERMLELESVRSLHRKSEQRLVMLEAAGQEKAVQVTTMTHKLQDAEEQLRVARRELEERRTGAESLRSHSDSVALQLTDMKTRNHLLEEKVKALTEQNEHLVLRNKSSQSTFEDLQEKGSQVRRSLEEKVQRYSGEMETLKAEAHEAVRLREEVASLKERIVGLCKNHSYNGEQELQKQVTALQIEKSALEQCQGDASYWKEQHTVIARDIARYQATNAANAVSIEGLEAQLAAEKSRYAEASALAAAKEGMLELERRNYASVQDLLAAARKAQEEGSSKCRELNVEVERLKGVVAEFETERKTWTSLHQSFMESKVEIEKITGKLQLAETAVDVHLKEISSLRAEQLSWDQLQMNYMKTQAECAALREAKLAAESALANANERVVAQEREKLELIGSLTTVSREWEAKNDKIAKERKLETAEFVRKFDDLSSEVLKLTERNTLLAADKIKYQQLQKEYDKLSKSSGSSFNFSAQAPPPSEERSSRTVDIDGPTQIVVQMGQSGGDEAQRAHLVELQEKNQLLTRLAGLHEAMEKLRYEPLSIDAAGDSGAPQSFHHSVLEDSSNISYLSDAPRMPSPGKTFPGSVNTATSGIKWEGGPVDGLGWSAYYLRDSKPRVPMEPLSTGSVGEVMTSPESRRPATAPSGGRRMESRGVGNPVDVASLGSKSSTLEVVSHVSHVSKSSTPGLGITHEGYYSGPAVEADQQRRQLHFGDDSSVTNTRDRARETPGRQTDSQTTMERDPWVGGGFEQHIVTQTQIVNTPVGTPSVTRTVTAEVLDSRSSTHTITASAADFGHGPPPAYIPTPAG